MTPDEDHQFYRFTDTALLRVHAPPVFLAPWLWLKRTWNCPRFSAPQVWYTPVRLSDQMLRDLTK